VPPNFTRGTRWSAYNEGMPHRSIDESPAPLKLPQFGLRTMFFVVALLGLLFALMGLIGPLASAALLLVLAVIGLHVAGNVVGTTLRNNAPVDAEQMNDSSRHGGLSARRSVMATLEPVQRDLTPPRLSERTGLGRLNGLCAGLGAVAGSAIGSSILEYSGDISVRGMIVGFISSGVLGAIFGLLFGCFLGMSLSAWWQATSESSSHKPAARHIRLPSFPRNVTPELVAEFDAG
jgi:MFS family permease